MLILNQRRRSLRLSHPRACHANSAPVYIRNADTRRAVRARRRVQYTQTHQNSERANCRSVTVSAASRVGDEETETRRRR